MLQFHKYFTRMIRHFFSFKKNRWLLQILSVTQRNLQQNEIKRHNSKICLFIVTFEWVASTHLSATHRLQHVHSIAKPLEKIFFRFHLVKKHTSHAETSLFRQHFPDYYYCSDSLLRKAGNFSHFLLFSFLSSTNSNINYFFFLLHLAVI